MFNLISKKSKREKNFRYNNVIRVNDNQNTGKTKHFSPSNKEWVITSYNFNNVNNKHLPTKYHLATKLFDSYFNLSTSYNYKSKTTIKRTKILIKSLKDIIINNLEIKSKYDKVIINLSFFNKQARLLKTKLLLLTKSWTDLNLYNNKIDTVNNINNYNTNNFVFHLLNKKNTIKNIFIFQFLTWLLKIYKVDIVMFNKNIENLQRLVIKYEDSKLIYFTKLPTTKFLPSIKKLLLCILSNQTDINDNKKKLSWLFNYFKVRYFNIIFYESMVKEALFMNNLYLFTINRNKFSKFVPQIRYILNNIFNKNIELNMINVKYIYMDTDILSEVIVSKLRKRNSRLMKVFKKSLDMIKFGSDSYSNKKRSTLKEAIHTFYKGNICNTISKIDRLTIQKNIINSTPYKWVKGIKIEAKGRLTRRYTASRSVYKYIYKGNLKNIDTVKYLKSNMLRTVIKPNMQHSFNTHKRRVGAFGIKGWISTK